MTISNLEVSFNGIFEVGQGYVALSRATCLEGLKLTTFIRNAVKAHDKVKYFYHSIKRLNLEIFSNCTSSSNANSDSNSSSDGDNSGCTTATIAEFKQLFTQQLPANPAKVESDWIDADRDTRYHIKAESMTNKNSTTTDGNTEYNSETYSKIKKDSDVLIKKESGPFTTIDINQTTTASSLTSTVPKKRPFVPPYEESLACTIEAKCSDSQEEYKFFSDQPVKPKYHTTNILKDEYNDSIDNKFSVANNYINFVKSSCASLNDNNDNFAINSENVFSLYSCTAEELPSNTTTYTSNYSNLDALNSSIPKKVALSDEQRR